MFIPVIDILVDIAGKTLTGDALLTQRKLAHYIVEDRQAHYVFTVKDNQPTLAQDIRLAFENRQATDYGARHIKREIIALSLRNDITLYHNLGCSHRGSTTLNPASPNIILTANRPSTPYTNHATIQ